MSYIGSDEIPEFIWDPSTDGFVCTRYMNVEESQFGTVGPDWLNSMLKMVPNGVGSYGEKNCTTTFNKINYFSTAKHLDSYDFSTLYTSIPHDSLKQAIKSLIKEAYRVRDSVFLVADHAGRAYWSNVPSSSSSRHSITEERLVIYVEYLIDNIYVSIGNRVYRQCVGIPMGTDCAPLLANLFLFYYEYGYMMGLIKTDLVLAKKFNNTMRYIDDLLTLNNATFHSAITDIYPHELQLKKTTECETQLSYLDILVTMANGKYSTAVYDKRDDFNFNIVNFPYLSSNIPSGPAYGVYISQLVRIGRICSNYTQFARRHYRATNTPRIQIFSIKYSL